MPIWCSYFLNEYDKYLEKEPSSYIKSLVYNFHSILSKIDKNFFVPILQRFNNYTFLSSNKTYCFVSLLKYARKVEKLTYDDEKRILRLQGYKRDITLKFLQNMLFNVNLDIRIQMMDILLLPCKMASIPNEIELELLYIFFKYNGFRCND